MSTLGKSGAAIASRIWLAVKARHRSLDILLPLLGVILAVDVATFSAGFGSNDDPGTYTSQAWAVLYRGDLAHYTYWYDHPPLGWLQIALYAWVTRGFERASIDVLMVSEFMVIVQLVSCALIFVLMRRLNFNRGFAALAVGLFALSPLAIYFQKMAFLDNIAIMWVLAAMVFAASPRRSLAASFGAAVCMVIATLTKETAGIWLPVLLYMLWQNSVRGHRKWVYGTFLTTFFLVSIFTYGLYAILKGELFPGKGHVSLLGALVWQVTRSEAGSNTVHGWLSVDQWMLYAAVAAIPLGLCFRRLRPITLGFLTLVAMVLRGGYIPAPLVIGMLPFAALLVAGALGSLWPYRSKVAVHSSKLLVGVRIALVAVMLAAGLSVAAPSWAKAGVAATSCAEVVYYQQTVAWIEANVPKDAVIAVDDDTWPDLYKAGYHNVVWFYKLDLDPAVAQKYVPHGYKGIDYIAMKQLYLYIARDSTGNSVISQAVQHSALVAQFGDPGDYSPQKLTDLYGVYRVNK